MAPQPRIATLLPIRNMRRALRFYTRKVGGRLENRGRGEMRNFWASVTLGSATFWLIAPDKREKRTLAYTAFLVRNIESFVRTLARRGVKFQPASKVSPETKVKGPIAYEPFGASAFFKDTEGNLLMVWQNNPEM
jgi:predicted enzyme related to lactoylglutathione lyase